VTTTTTTTTSRNVPSDQSLAGVTADRDTGALFLRKLEQARIEHQRQAVPLLVTSGSDLTLSTVTPIVESARDTESGSTAQWWHRRGKGADNEAISGVQKWEGRILELDETIFSAELSPLSEEGPVLVADFDVRLLLPEADVSVGDVIYVTARLVERERGMPPSKTVSVRLRRMGKWSEDEIDMIKRRAHDRWARLADFID
jgi:hypothetical protein